MATRPSTNHDARSPNAHLCDFLLRFFADGPHLAALRYRICSQAIKLPLLSVARGGPGQLPPSLPKPEDLHAIVQAQINDHAFVQTLVAQSPWEDSKMAAEFVTLLLTDLADPDARLRGAAFNSRKLGGVPTSAQLRIEPPADLPAALAHALAVHRAGDAGRAATGGVTVSSSCTALAVSLVDCAALRAAEQLRQQQWQQQQRPLLQHQPRAVPPQPVISYSHRFVLLVDGTGVGLYQAWGSGGDSNTKPNDGNSGGSYSLQDWLQRCPVPMSYDQAAEFAAAFQEFCGCLQWGDAANALYLRLFGVDLRALAAEAGLAAPGRIRSWARVLEVPYVTAERVEANAALFM